MKRNRNWLVALLLATFASSSGVSAQVSPLLVDNPNALLEKFFQAMRTENNDLLRKWLSLRALNTLKADSNVKAILGNSVTKVSASWQTETKNRKRILATLQNQTNLVLEISISKHTRKIVFVALKYKNDLSSEASASLENTNKKSLGYAGRSFVGPRRGGGCGSSFFSKIGCNNVLVRKSIVSGLEKAHSFTEHNPDNKPTPLAYAASEVIKDRSSAIDGKISSSNSPSQLVLGKDGKNNFQNYSQQSTMQVPAALDLPTTLIPSTVLEPIAPQVVEKISSALHDSRAVSFYYCTTRQKGSGATRDQDFTRARSASTSYGTVKVHVPEDHRIGQIERPEDTKLFWIFTIEKGKQDKGQHFVIESVSHMDKNEFTNSLRNHGESDAFVFIHGFNTSFEDASYRSAQIFYDMQFNGIPVLFSWASGGAIADYGYDKESAYIARGAFIDLIETLKAQPNIKKLHVLAHSMGNLVALDALWNYTKTPHPVKITNLIMAAPDFDSDQFRSMVPDLHRIVGGMTLYASSTDKALALSKSLAGGIPRAGDVPNSGPIVLPSLETVDVTAIGDEIFGLNHNVFATTRSIMNDLKLLLNGIAPPRLSEVRGHPNGKTPPTYWRFVP